MTSKYSGFIDNETRRALQGFKNLQVLDPEVTVVKTKTGKSIVTFDPDHAKLGIARPVPVFIPPVTFSAGTMSNQTPITFRINPGLCGHIEKVYLMLQFRNTDASNVVLPTLIPFCIDHIDYFFNGNEGAPWLTQQSLDLYQQFEWIDPNTTSALFAHNALNMSGTTYDTPSTIGVSTTANYILPLLTSCFNHTNPHTINRDMVMNLYMRNNPVESGSGTLIINNAWLYMITTESPARSVAMKELSLAPIYRPFIRPVYQETAITLTAGVYTDIQLQLIGRTAVLAFVIRSAPTTVAGGEIYNFEFLSGAGSSGGNLEITDGTIDVLNAEGTTILASGSLRPFQAGTFFGLYNTSPLSCVKPNYFIPFCDDPIGAVLQGKDSGNYNFQAKERLRLTPGTAFTSGTYTVSIIAYQIAGTIEEGGTFYPAN